MSTRRTPLRQMMNRRREPLRLLLFPLPLRNLRRLQRPLRRPLKPQVTRRTS